jgi:hypothetical protein
MIRIADCAPMATCRPIPSRALAESGVGAADLEVCPDRIRRESCTSDDNDDGFLILALCLVHCEEESIAASAHA